MITSLREVDLHLHAGLERNVSMNDLLNWCEKDGRKIVSLIDHDFLYWRSPEEFRAWLSRKGFKQRYSCGVEGIRQFFAHVALQREKRKHRIKIFQAIEVYNQKLGTTEKLASLPIDLYIGLDIFALEVRTYGDQPGAGKELRRWAEALSRLCIERDLIGIICHPFMYTYEKILKSGSVSPELRRAGTIYLPEEIESMVGSSWPDRVYLEVSGKRIINLYLNYPKIYRMLANTLRQLKQLGVPFTIGSDYHSVPPGMPYAPEKPCEEAGLQLEDFKIIDALLERFERRYS